MRKMLDVPALGMPHRQGGTALPRDEGGPVFPEPWQAHAFAVVMALYEEGHYTWAEWDDYLGYEIHAPGHFSWSEGNDDWTDEAVTASDVRDADEAWARPNYSRWRAACEADGSKFYHRWLAACENLLVAKGIVTKDELDERVSALAETERAGPRFTPGERVVVRDIDRVGHTHLPRYLRGKSGVIESDRGVFAFPEASDHDGSEFPQHIYTVRFTAHEVWGTRTSDRNNLYFNLWDYHMDPA